MYLLLQLLMCWVQLRERVTGQSRVQFAELWNQSASLRSDLADDFFMFQFGISSLNH